MGIHVFGPDDLHKKVAPAPCFSTLYAFYLGPLSGLNIWAVKVLVLDLDIVEQFI